MRAETLFHNAQAHQTAAAGDVVYSEGEPGEFMYGIVSGAVELRKGTVTVARLGPGDVFGQRSLIDQLPRNLTAVATSDTTLARIDHALFLFLVHETPMFGVQIMSALASRLRDYDDLIASSQR